MDARPILIAGASRPHPDETTNGDAWLATWHAGALRLAVVDGLGHGPLAAEAAQAAVAVLADRPALEVAPALEACHAALRGSRGAAISIALVDPAAGQLSFAGLGNVEARLLGAGQQRRLLPQRGIAGVVLPRLRPLTLPLAPDWLLLLHSDGVRSRFELEPVRLATDAAAQQFVDALLRGWARDIDDATVVVAAPPADAPPPLSTG